MIDTNIAIHARDGNDLILQKFDERVGAIMLSTLSLAELQRGLFKNPANTTIRQARLKTILEYIQVLPFDAAAAEAYGRIIALCGWAKGLDFDRMIAAHALCAKAVLVTNNQGGFRDIPGLHVENWAVA